MIAAWPCPGGGEEYAVSFDHQRPTRLLVIPALFDESNKLRRLTVETMRLLDKRGIDTFLPDLPGWNESAVPLEIQTLQGWRHATESAARHFGASHVLSIRAGANLAPPSLSGWRYAPIGGNAALRALLRARILSSREAGLDENRDDLLAIGRDEGLVLAGYRLGAMLVAELEQTELPERARQTDVAQSEIGGGGLWLRAEPGYNAEQAARLASTIFERIEA